MRPPAHWQLRKRSGPPLVLTILAGLSFVFLIAIALVLLPSGDTSTPTLTGPACPGGSVCVDPFPSVSHAGVVDPPTIVGRAAIVLEEPCGAELYAKDAARRLAPASLTKLATALVAVERADLDATVSVDVNSALLVASSGSTVMGLQPGLRVTMRDLLYGLLLPSGNDAAIAIAEDVGGTTAAFVDLMNLKARELALADTHFSNPHGLDEPGLYSSARDMALLGRAVLANDELSRIVATQRYQPSWDGPELWNGNELLSLYDGEVLGVKIGYTEDAAQTMVLAVEREGRRLIVSLLGSLDRYGDVISLFEWAFAHTAPAC